jgi:hypothetical protein
MKIHRIEKFVKGRSCLARRKEGGFIATVLFIALLVIMLMLATAGAMAVVHLHDEVKVLERQQIKKFDMPATNSVSISSSQPRKNGY